MKGKFSLIWRVAIALVLVLSFSLVTAVPVAATHTSSADIAFATGESNIAGATGVILDVEVTNESGDNIKTVKIDFSSSGFTVTGSGTAPIGWTGSGPTADVVTYTHATGIAEGDSKTFSPVVTNPAAGSAAVPAVLTTDVAASVKATLAFSADTGWIGYTAVTAGAAGNNIAIIYGKQLAVYDPLDVTVAGTVITVKLAVDADPFPIISTAAEVAAAVNADAQAKLLVLAAVAVGKDAVLVPVMGSTALTGGITSVADYNCVEDPLTLTVIAVPSVVWVDDDGSDANPGTEASPVATIAQGLSIAPAYGTVNVLPGTYKPAASLHINQAGLTLQSTDGAEVTIIDASSFTPGAGPGAPIYTDKADVTVDGFTISDCGGNSMAYGPSSSGGTIQNNVITDSAQIPINISGSGHLVANNTIEDSWSIYLNSGVSDITIENNTITGSIATGEGAITLSGLNDDNTITGNTITGSVGAGIFFWGAEGTGDMDGNVIEDNTIDGNLNGIGFADLAINIKNLTITGNDITNSSGAGILLAGTTTITWGTGNTISNNNISGNTEYGMNNGSGEVIDAENNWWGDASGPYHATTNSAGTGDVVSDKVDYRPWLEAEYGVAEVTTISLESGWNFISVPKRMAAATDTFGELLTGITTEASYSYDPVGGWSLLLDATPIEVLEGYWVDVATAGTVTLSYKEAGQDVPASKSLVGDAWNAIGFSSTTARDADTALMSIQGSWSTVLGWDAEGQAYEDSIIATGAGNMSPGKGYWIWMTEADVLSAISG